MYAACRGEWTWCHLNKKLDRQSHSKDISQAHRHCDCWAAKYCCQPTSPTDSWNLKRYTRSLHICIYAHMSVSECSYCSSFSFFFFFLFQCFVLVFLFFLFFHFFFGVDSPKCLFVFVIFFGNDDILYNGLICAIFTSWEKVCANSEQCDSPC